MPVAVVVPVTVVVAVAVAVAVVVVVAVAVAVAVFAVVVVVGADGVTVIVGLPDDVGGEDDEAPEEEADFEPVLAEDDGPDGEPEEVEAEPEPEVEPEVVAEVEAEVEPEVVAEVEAEVDPDTEADGVAGFIGAAGGMPGASSFGGWTGRSSTLTCPVTRANQPPVETFTRMNSLTGCGAGTTMTSVDGWKPAQEVPVYLASVTRVGGPSGLPQAHRTRGTPCASTRTEVPACRTDW
ncbi:hypothetical protein C2142_02395 [Streptomyces sp. CB01881]|nr:hypothetical protein C2142_02395 [Streptomyces sp. CB01881]